MLGVKQVSEHGSSGPPSPKASRSTEESKQLILEHRQSMLQLRKQRKAAEKERKRLEIEEGERIAQRRMMEEIALREEKERRMEERLAALRQRREARELEFLVGERRAKEVLTRRTLTDKYEAEYAKKLEEEDEERRRALEERRERMRAPIHAGIEEADRMIREVEAKKERRAQEVRAQLEEAERTAPVHWHGKSYLYATEEYVKNKHGNEDQKHSALYRHAKMQEYGKLVKHIAAEDTPHYSHPALRSSSTGPGDYHHASPSPNDGRKTAPPTVAKQPASIAERNRAGNNYLREAIREKPPLPPGLKLQPIEREEDRLRKEHEQFKKRKRAGDQYLRELRDATGHAQPPPPEDEEQYLADIRRLKSKANSIENRLAVRGTDLEGTRQSMGELGAQEVVAESDDYLEIVRAKLELLNRIEKFERGGRSPVRRQKSSF